MSLRRGEPWGTNGPLPADGVTVGSDAAAGELVTDAVRRGDPPPVIGLLGGDLCRTLGGRGDRARLATDAATRATVDVGWVELDGAAPQAFVAHVVVRRRLWRGRSIAVMNAAWIDAWNVAPRAHPGDARLDVVDTRLGLGDRLKARRRLPLGTHVPHPAIDVRRAATYEVALDRPTGVWVDGRPVGRARRVKVTLEPDALDVVV